MRTERGAGRERASSGSPSLARPDLVGQRAAHQVTELTQARVDQLHGDLAPGTATLHATFTLELRDLAGKVRLLQAGGGFQPPEPGRVVGLAGRGGRAGPVSSRKALLEYMLM